MRVQKKIPHTLIVSVEERSSWGIFCSANSECAYIDAKGFAYESAPLFSGMLVTKIMSDASSSLIIPSQAVEQATMQKITEIGDHLKDITGSANVSYELTHDLPREIHAVTPEGYKIYFDRDSDLLNAFRVVKTLLAGELKDKYARLDYIDVRFGNKVFYKLK